MKTIKLNIEDEVYEDLKSALVSKHITGGLYGINDEFLKLVIKAIDDGMMELQNVRLRGNNGNHFETTQSILP